MLRLGKHRGASFETVAQQDRSYCAWIFREHPQGFKRFHKYLAGHHGGVIAVGKYKGQFFDEVLRNDPGYARWVQTLGSDPGAFKVFYDWLQTHPAKDDDEEPEEHEAKKTKKDDDTCKICCVRNIDSVLVPCGHVISCMSCSERFDGGPCPICKQGVALVLKTYRA